MHSARVMQVGRLAFKRAFRRVTPPHFQIGPTTHRAAGAIGGMFSDRRQLDLHRALV